MAGGEPHADGQFSPPHRAQHVHACVVHGHDPPHDRPSETAALRLVAGRAIEAFAEPREADFLVRDGLQDRYERINGAL
jgi:hypothetical protein